MQQRPTMLFSSPCHRAGSIHSLSTTASSSGSSSPSAGNERGMPRSKLAPSCALGFDIEYPVPLIVRNTFLEFPVERSDSLDVYLNERKCQSAPGSKVDGNFPIVDDGECIADGRAPQCSELAHSPLALQIADMLLLSMSPQPTSADFPTIGSLGHLEGRCKPCAFFWKESGCNNGYECQFCHLCDAREKKRRQKDKREHLKEARKHSGSFRQAVVSSFGRFVQ